MKPSNNTLPAADVRQRNSSNIKRLRHDRRLSQKQLAELAYFHRTYVSQLERRVTNITIEGPQRHAGALDADISELLDRSA